MKPIKQPLRGQGPILDNKVPGPGEYTPNTQGPRMKREASRKVSGISGRWDSRKEGDGYRY